MADYLYEIDNHTGEIDSHTRKAISRFKMPIDLKDRWLTALRSGKYGQAMGELRKVDELWHDTTPDKFSNSFCCLGVLIDTINPTGWNPKPTIHQEFVHSLQRSKTESSLISKSLIPGRIQSILAKMNDDGYTFSEIADWIEKNIKTK